nr:tocopherol o-methyltransferase, chloroplastic [Quercus suber]
MENGEHMPDKAKFVNELARVTAPGGTIIISLSLQDIKAKNWSEYVVPFWPAVIRSALTWKGLTSLLRSGKLDNSCGS